MSMVGRVLVTAAVVGITLAGCGGGSDGNVAATRSQTAGQGVAVGEPNGGTPVVSDFILQAMGASCAESRNNLFVIDNKYVLWGRAGQCADASYAQTLHGPTPQALLCSSGDTIAGPRTSCTDEALRPLFDTVLKNLDKADLGLGAGHKVEYVPFLPKPGTVVPFTSLVNDGFSNITAPRQVVVKDAAAWSALWAEHSKTRIAAPEVDFSRNMVVAVFLGDVSSACKTISVVHAESRDAKLVVEVEERDITAFAMCLPVISQPMHAVVVPRYDAPVEFVRFASDFRNFRTVEQGGRSQIQSPRDVVVRDAASWAALWQEHTGGTRPLPQIDFSKEMVVGVFLGEQSSACYSTEIDSVRAVGGKLKVLHSDTIPGELVRCAMALTYPHHLVAVERSDAPVEFSKEIRTLK